MSDRTYDVAIVGGGCVGTATAMVLSKRARTSVVLLEAEEGLARHQTGNNSGVIHSGLYYKPGSLKAKNCVEGRKDLLRFCEEQNITHECCGKLVVARHESEIGALSELEERGRANGLEGLRRLKSEEIKEVEPHVQAVAGLQVAETGIVDYEQVTAAFGRVTRERGGEIRTRSRVLGFARETGGLVLETSSGPVHARHLINCTGLQSDRVARMCGVEPNLRIVPFRGEYYDLLPAQEHLVRKLIYPVPDPRFPFLGVHFTRMIHGGVEAGPNAVLAFKREGYRKSQISIKDMGSWMFYGGFWRMVFRHWRMGIGEMWRSISKRAFVKSMQAMIPEIDRKQVRRGGAGVRAQALAPDGSLVDDFRMIQAERMIHVLNAPSPAATASISIGRSIVAMAEKNFDLP